MPTDTLELDRQLNALIIQRKTPDAFLLWKNGRVVRERFYHK